MPIESAIVGSFSQYSVDEPKLSMQIVTTNTRSSAPHILDSESLYREAAVETNWYVAASSSTRPPNPNSIQTVIYALCARPSLPILLRYVHSWPKPWPRRGLLLMAPMAISQRSNRWLNPSPLVKSTRVAL